MATPLECDVLVAGGGPAGSTIATLLAQKGRHVVVLEQARFPRFHIGESLLPLNLPLFDRLGVGDDVRRIGVHKPGAELVSDESDAATIFRFADNPRLSFDRSYHVVRADFDKLLLDNSRRLGATVMEGTRVAGITLGANDRSRITAVGPDGAPTQWSARYFVDATGRDTLLARKLGLKRADRRNNTAALFGHFHNVPRRHGADAGLITMYLFEYGWFWVIPLPNDIMSVGLVGTKDFFKSRSGTLDSFFAGAVAATPALADRMANAKRIGPLTACADYSYDSRHYTGDGYILVGDAAAFIDPLFSSGVMMAMSSAAFGADVVEAALAGNASVTELMRDYERKVRRSLNALSWLICRINSPILRDIFLSPFDLFNTRAGVIAVLAGDLYGEPSLLSPLRRVQIAYGCLLLLSKLGFRLHRQGPLPEQRIADDPEVIQR